MIDYYIRWLGGWLCYMVGDLISKLPGGWWYQIYNWLMIKSSDLDHDDLGIWYRVNDD